MTFLSRHAMGFEKIICRMFLLLAGLLIIVACGAAHYSQWLRPTEKVTTLTPGSDMFRIQSYGPRSICRADAPPAPRKDDTPGGRLMSRQKEFFAPNPLWGNYFRVRAVTEMDRVFVIESSQILYARLFMDQGDGWREASRWRSDGANGVYVNPAFSLSFARNSDVHLFVCFQTASGMSPLFSLRSVGSMLTRLGLQALWCGAMFAILLVTSLHAFSFRKISSDEVIPLTVLVAPFAACFSLCALGLYALIAPGHDALVAARVGQTSAAIIFALFLYYLVRKIKSQNAILSTRRLLHVLPVCPLLLLPIIHENYRISQDILIMMGIASALAVFAASVVATNRDRQSCYYVIIGSLAVLIGLSYVFAWFDMLPSDWITNLCSAFGPVFSLAVGLHIMCRNHDSHRYLAAQVRYRDRTVIREAKRHAAARMRTFALINHDMRQPLQVMGISLALLKGRLLDTASSTLLDRLLKATECFSGFVDGLLDVSRLEAGAMVPRLESFDINTMLTQLAVEFRDIAAEKNLALRHVACHGLWVRSDPRILQRILRNLISNAINHTETGRILLGCRRSGQNEIAIEVLDTGPGIDTSASRRAFNENYHRLSSDRRGGLGLFIVAELAAILGHRIGVMSKVGQGSRFIVNLPRTKAATISKINGRSARPLQLSELRILCLERDCRVSESLRRHPAMDVCDIFTAAGQRQVMDLLAAGIVPDVVIVSDDIKEQIGLAIVEHLEQALRWPVPAVILADQAGRYCDTERLDRLVIGKSDRVCELLQAISALADPGRQPGPRT